MFLRLNVDLDLHQKVFNLIKLIFSGKEQYIETQNRSLNKNFSNTNDGQYEKYGGTNSKDYTSYGKRESTDNVYDEYDRHHGDDPSHEISSKSKCQKIVSWCNDLDRLNIAI